MRIALVTESFLPTVNGVSRSVASVVEQLERLELPPGPVQPQHERGPQPRAPRVLSHQGLQVAHDGRGV